MSDEEDAAAAVTARAAAEQESVESEATEATASGPADGTRGRSNRRGLAVSPATAKKRQLCLEQEQAAHDLITHVDEKANGLTDWMAMDPSREELEREAQTVTDMLAMLDSMKVGALPPAGRQRWREMAQLRSAALEMLGTMMSRRVDWLYSKEAEQENVHDSSVASSRRSERSNPPATVSSSALAGKSNADIVSTLAGVPGGRPRGRSSSSSSSSRSRAVGGRSVRPSTIANTRVFAVPATSTSWAGTVWSSAPTTSLVASNAPVGVMSASIAPSAWQWPTPTQTQLKLMRLAMEPSSVPTSGSCEAETSSSRSMPPLAEAALSGRRTPVVGSARLRPAHPREHYRVSGENTGPPTLSLSAPTGSSSAGPVAFEPNVCQLSNQYYLSLPPPWNVLPQASTVGANELLKISTPSLPTFDGTPTEYLSWRDSFIPCVHRTNVNITLKVLILRKTMQPKTRRMRDFISNIVMTEQGYRQAIELLEERYGGLDSLLMARQGALLALPEVKEGDYPIIESMQSRLGTFLLDWAQVGDTALDETESKAFFAILMNKFEESYSRQYFQYLERVEGEHGLQTLYAWLTQQLKTHRMAKRFARRKEPPSRTIQQARPLKIGESRDRIFVNDWGAEGDASDVVEDLWEEADGDLEIALVSQEQGRKPPCPLCTGSHPVARCEKFLQMKADERKEFLRKERRCYLCFQKNHNVNRCTRKFRCIKCQKTHHTLLHGADGPPTQTGLYAGTLGEEDEEEVAATEEMNEYIYVKSDGFGHTLVSLRTVALRLKNPINQSTCVVNALLDDGCTSAALVSRRVADHLGLRGREVVAHTEGVGGQLSTYKTFTAPVSILSLVGQFEQVVPAQVMERPAGSYRPVDWNIHKKRFPHLQDIDFPPVVRDRGVDVMIGNKFPYFLSSLREIAAKPGSPIARLTPLGWTATGPTREVALETLREGMALATRCVAPRPLAQGDGGEWMTGRCLLTLGGQENSRSSASDKQLARLVEQMLELQEIAEVEVLSPREEFAIKQIRASLTQLGDGRYQAPCTWRPGGTRPPVAYKRAETRFFSLERSKYFRDSNVRRAYGAVIADWQKRLYVREVEMGDEVRHLLPHFPIIKCSSSTPVRPVMDCATELNKHVLAGPNLLNEVPAVLLRYRSGLYGFSGDVKQMFLQIALHPDDRPYHCFLWRDSAATNFKIFQFMVHVFGNAGSPFVAVYVVKQHAQKYIQTLPGAVDSLQRSTLIDDVLDSADTLEGAKSQLCGVAKILKDAGMTLSKLHASHPQILQPFEDNLKEKGMLDVAGLCQKEVELSNLTTLGLKYDPRRDSFFFQMECTPPRVWTRRQILKIFPRLYDPLGLLLPFTMIARIYFSKVVRETTSWDEGITPSEDWLDWLRALDKLENYSIPRALRRCSASVADLHIFSDASEKAYAAAAYLRSENETGQVYVSLVMSRAHVAPTKKQTVPRLELLAAVLAVKLRTYVVKHLKIVLRQIHHWTDSTTVLYWLNNDSKRFQAFVANNLRRIWAGSGVEEWHWVPTDHNPADLPSRGLRLEDLLAADIWNQGPRFLQKAPVDWPTPPKLVPTSTILQELKKQEQIFSTTDGQVLEVLSPHLIVDWSRHSSWLRLWRAFAWILRNLAAKGLGSSTHCSPNVWKRAELLIVKQAQAPMVSKWLKNPIPLTQQQLGFSQLPLVLDENGVLRGEGRLRFAVTIPEDQRKPILMPRAGRATELLLDYFHSEVAGHYGGVNYVLSLFHMRFWAPQIRALATRVLKNCLQCRQHSAKPSRPLEAPLPDFRLPKDAAAVKPFEVTAMDCAGPYRVRVGRSQVPYYMLLVTCCHVRAVKLDWLSDMSLDALMLALTRLASRGVDPSIIISDNGSNFDAASGLLHQMLAATPDPQLYKRNPKIVWKFNPPYASHYGGVFERLIGAAKRALNHAIPVHQSLSLEQLLTAFSTAEAILNARPLTYTSTATSDLVPLTPNNFLYGSASLQLAPVLMAGCSNNKTKRWNLMTRIHKMFEERFRQEILPTYHLTHKKAKSCTPIKKGDVVTFFCPSVSSRWPLARVDEVFPGRDGHVRTVRLWAPPTDTRPERYFTRDVGSVALLVPEEDSGPGGEKEKQL